MDLRSRLIATLLVVASLGGPGAAAAAPDQESGLRPTQRFPFRGGLELAAWGPYLYASQWNGHLNRVETPEQGGVHIFDVSKKRVRKVGYLHCPGYDNDVAAVGRGVIAIGYGENACARDPRKPGVLLADVSDPSRPRVLGSVDVYFSHTLSVHPTRPLIYASTGGWLPDHEGRVDVIDVSNPSKPKTVGAFTFRGYGCHDISFDIRKDRKLAFCTNSSAAQLILDISDPVEPVVISTIVNPLIQYGHTSMVSPDGKLLAITDEAFVAHACGNRAGPVGALWIYDISDPRAPVPVSHVGPPQGDEVVGHLTGWMPSYCAAGMLDWIDGSRDLVVSWYTGGTEVLDLAQPSAPKTIATYRPDDALAYGVDYYRGRVFLNDINRGVEVLELTR